MQGNKEVVTTNSESGAESIDNTQGAEWTQAMQDVEFAGARKPAEQDVADTQTETSVENQAEAEERPKGNSWAKLTGYYKRHLDQIGDLVEQVGDEPDTEKIEWYQNHPDKVHQLVKEYLDRQNISAEKIISDMYQETQAEKTEADTTADKAESASDTTETTETDNNDTPENKFGEIRFKVEGDKTYKPDPEKYLVYSASDSEQVAIPRENVVEAYRDSVNNINSAKDYFTSTRLGSQIAHEYEGNQQVMEELKEIESSQAYVTNRLKAELESAEKVLKMRSQDLVNSQMELDKLSQGGPFKRLMKRMARKTAKERVDWTQRDIENAKSDIERIKGQLREIGVENMKFTTQAAEMKDISSAENTENQSNDKVVPFPVQDQSEAPEAEQKAA
ncbi:hypothetical protein IKE88_00180 [Candidatus Saccharibacteria bacterium]|nr:hypothetical protein [Candidatus Saccharibacteria bacterium]